MPRKPEKPGKKKGRILLIVLVLSVIFGAISLRFGASNVTGPASTLFADINGRVQQALFYPALRIKAIWDSYIDLVNLKERNAVLRAQLSELRSEITTYREALIENRRLRQLLDMKRRHLGKTIVAHIVGCDLASWTAVVTVDRGKKDGLEPDMPVLVRAGVIGRVIDTSMSFSRVLLISDYHSRIAALIQRNRARGLLHGQGSGKCSLDFVKKGVDVQVGDTIITSGMDEIFPKGLILGKVISVNPGDKSELFQDIRVEPSSKIEELEEVLILLTTKPDTGVKMGDR